MNDAKLFIEALEELGSSKGISREDILNALQEVLERGFKKQLGGDDALVRVNIDPENGTIYMAQIKMIVADVEDDFLEISLEDARKTNKKAKEGD
ncbi:MAG: NusA N-terminal domain-containing protein, partial [Bacilli bacterium]